jgi:uncharacterized membrane protein YccC
MRGRLVFIILAALVVAGIAALNWPEITRSGSTSFGVVDTNVPLGVVMLTLVGIVLAVFLVSSAIQESRYLLEHRRHSRALQAQRELAEKAETSRFTDLRQHLDSHLRETRQRDTIVATEFEKTVMQSQRDVQRQLDQLNHTLATRLGDIEARLPAGDVRAEPVAPVEPVTDVPVRDRVRM